MLEHFQYPWALPGLQSSMALDGVFELCGMVAARRLVREKELKF